MAFTLLGLLTANCHERAIKNHAGWVLAWHNKPWLWCHYRYYCYRIITGVCTRTIINLEQQRPWCDSSEVNRGDASLRLRVCVVWIIYLVIRLMIGAETLSVQLGWWRYRRDDSDTLMWIEARCAVHNVTSTTKQSSIARANRSLIVTLRGQSGVWTTHERTHTPS